MPTSLLDARQGTDGFVDHATDPLVIGDDLDKIVGSVQSDSLIA